MQSVQAESQVVALWLFDSNFGVWGCKIFGYMTKVLMVSLRAEARLLFFELLGKMSFSWAALWLACICIEPKYLALVAAKIFCRAEVRWANFGTLVKFFERDLKTIFGKFIESE
jgi:hypothetical protein